jgi:hypothetical protein
MIKPNFFLLGAPKSGSTALYAYLQPHPEIYLPRLKEPRYFASDFGAFREITDLAEYEALYCTAPPEARIVGDGSPWYLCSREAIPAIRAYSPNAFAIAMVRNPLEMLPSLHNQFLFSYKETERDLETAWALQEERRLGKHIPPAAPAPALLQYGEMTSFGAQVEHLLANWPADRVKVILFDDFRTDTPQVYREVLEFLGVADDGRSDFPVINEAAGHRNQTLGWVFNSPASPVYRSLMVLRRVTGVRSSGLVAPLLRGNRERGAKQAISSDFRQALISYYREDVAKLGRLIGRDLSHWLGS